MFRILVIEDVLMLRRLLKTSLQVQGFEVFEAEDGETALALACSVRPTLIIADLHLPGISGIEVCRQIKANPDLAATFFILLSADNSPGKQELARAAGANAFLTKPLKVEELGARLRAWIRLHGLKAWMQVQQDFKEERQLAQALRFQQQILETELGEAASYVRSLLPKPCESPVAIDYQFLPSRYLGGDCFDYFWLDADRLVIYLLDVSGHGLGAALFSVSVQSVLRSQSLPNVHFDQPDQVLSALNQRFQSHEEHARYFTMWYSVYRLSSRELVYASAGHPPALLLSGRSARCLKTQGKPIGLFSEAQFQSSSCSIDQPSALYVFSDGIYEFVQESGKTWTIEELMQLLTGAGESGYSTTEQIVQTVRAKISGGEFGDDCSILRVRLG
jgi:phosphoserine phosphatase RsbU/P